MSRTWTYLALLWALAKTATAAEVKPPPKLVTVAAPQPRDERIVPLGPAEVRELSGTATVHSVTTSPTAGPQTLLRGMTLSGSVRIGTAADAGSRTELRFSDGSLLRLGADTQLTILPTTRQIALHKGRVLVASDRMVGGLSILTAGRAFLPEGTTYVVEVSSGSEKPATTESARLTVLEGAVCACAVVGPTATGKTTAGQPPLRPLPRPAREQIVLPGEAFHTARKAPTSLPWNIDLAATLRSEPLLTAFPSPLPSLAKIAELAEQQRRKLLPGRNARLRREIFWKRPPRPPLTLPALFAEPSSVTVTYE